MAGVRKAGRKDLLVMRLAEGSAGGRRVSRGIRFCAAPVLLARRHLKNAVRALVVNTGNCERRNRRGGAEARPVRM
jgi:glutamate N-acetyltransferase/amino-acid N-acetyltransferase